MKILILLLLATACFAADTTPCYACIIKGDGFCTGTGTSKFCQKTTVCTLPND